MKIRRWIGVYKMVKMKYVFSVKIETRVKEIEKDSAWVREKDEWSESMK